MILPRIPRPDLKTASPDSLIPSDVFSPAREAFESQSSILSQPKKFPQKESVHAGTSAASMVLCARPGAKKVFSSEKLRRVEKGRSNPFAKKGGFKVGK